MSARPWYSLGHMVRMLAADLVLAMVAVTVLLCNLRNDCVILLPATAEGTYSTLNPRSYWEHGWPLTALKRLGPVVDDPMLFDGSVLPVRGAIPPFPGSGGSSELWEVEILGLVFDVLVALLVIGSTAYATRRWLQVRMKFYQISLLSMLVLPAVPIVVYMVAEIPGPVPHVLLSGFFWLGVVCTLFVVKVLVARLLRRLSSKGT